MTIFTSPNFSTTIELLELISIFTLVLLLILRELTTPSESPFAHIFNRTLNIAIVPLLIAFAFIVATRIVELK